MAVPKSLVDRTESKTRSSCLCTRKNNASLLADMTIQIDACLSIFSVLSLGNCFFVCVLMFHAMVVECCWTAVMAVIWSDTSIRWDFLWILFNRAGAILLHYKDSSSRCGFWKNMNYSRKSVVSMHQFSWLVAKIQSIPKNRLTGFFFRQSLFIATFKHSNLRCNREQYFRIGLNNRSISIWPFMPPPQFHSHNSPSARIIRRFRRRRRRPCRFSPL